VEVPVLQGKLMGVETVSSSGQKGTSEMKHRRAFPRLVVSGDGEGCVSLAGTQLLTETAAVSGLDVALSSQLSRWRLPLAVHDPGKIVLDLAVSLAVGGDCPADVAALREQPELFGLVASDPTVCRLIDRLARNIDAALSAVRAARAAARARVWELVGPPGCDRDSTEEAGDDDEVDVGNGEPVLVIIDGDGTLLDAHSEKEQAAPTFKRGFGFHPLLAYIDHGPTGTGEAAAVVLRPGNAGANTAADQIALIGLALAQLPTNQTFRVLYRADGAGCSHQLLEWLVEHGIEFSVGFHANEPVAAAIQMLPRQAWRRALDSDGNPRPGAWVAELTGHLNLSGWPAGMRVIARKEHPHPGAQLRLTDVDGNRITCFATMSGGRLADLEVRHRRRARCEDRIRAAKDTGLRNLPYHDFARNELWCEIVLLAQDLTAWCQTLALTGDYKTAEPKRLRLHLFSVAGQLIHGGRRLRLRLARSWRWTPTVLAATHRLHALPRPG
jgi:hypothetical protein